MFKRLVVIGIVILFFIPFQSEAGLNLNIYTKDKSKISSQGFDEDIIDMINEINYTILFGYLEKIVSFGSRFTGTENCRKAAEYINEEFQSLGLDSYIDEWDYPILKFQNVIGTLNGTDPTSDAVFVLTAHLDSSRKSVGANDDGSGVAALLTIANITSKYQFNHTIKFVIVSGHEIGIWGSFDYAKKAYRRNENIIANLNVDAIGNTTFGNIVEAFTPERSCWLYYYINEVNHIYANYIELKIQLATNYPVDSQSFVDYGYDAITFGQPNVFDYPLHTPKDTLDKIVYPYFENVTKLILTLTAELANRKIDLQVRITAPREGYIYLFKWPIVKLPGLNLVITRVRGMTYLIGKTIVKINITTNEDIIAVFYSIDGSVVDLSGVIYEPPYDWRIKRPFFRWVGKHKLGVHVYTSTGKTAYDEMDFYALTPI